MMSSSIFPFLLLPLLIFLSTTCCHSFSNTNVATTTRPRQLRLDAPQTQFSTSRFGSKDVNVDPSSLICAQDDTTQQLAFVGLMTGVVLGTVPFVSLYTLLENLLPSQIFSPFYTVLPIVLAMAFGAAGVAHFALEETFLTFVPPKGAWGGLWQVPSPGAKAFSLSYAQYHSYWTGIAEILCSLAFMANTLGVAELGPYPATLLFLLTLTVTPANIYMFTHNPDVPNIPPVTYPTGHVARGILQCALLAVFFKLALHSATM
jgi:uncharacterized membrane protein